MTNRYLEKIAKSDHILEGLISPALQEKSIVKQYGKEGPTGFKQQVKSHLKGELKSLPKVGVGAVGGAILGGLAGRLSPRKYRALSVPAGAYLGSSIGMFSGSILGRKALAKDYHAEYSK